jgi:Holliday junction DNA helicase RuvA
MISYISGKVFKNNIGKNNFVEVLLNSGLAYRVYVTSKYLFVEKDSLVEMYTSFQVREDSQTLYGFASEKERDFFEQLLTVSGVGPKLGLSILSTYSLEQLRDIITEGDSKLLSKVAGLGSKGAQKIILELRGKIDFDKESKGIESDEKIKELKGALRTLGFSGKSLEESLAKAEELLSKEDMDIESLIRKTLSND